MEPRSPLEHDHKLFPRLLNAIIDLGNDDPDLVGASWGMGTKDRGGALAGEENRPDFIRSPDFKNLIIVKKRDHSANGLILRRSV